MSASKLCHQVWRRLSSNDNCTVNCEQKPSKEEVLCKGTGRCNPCDGLLLQEKSLMESRVVFSLKFFMGLEVWHEDFSSMVDSAFKPLDN